MVILLLLEQLQLQLTAFSFVGELLSFESCPLSCQFRLLPRPLRLRRGRALALLRCELA